MPTKTAKRPSHTASKGTRKWSAGVDTDSTSPPEALFTKDAKTIARSLASKKISPKGPASGMRMLTFYINRAGTNLPAARLKELNHAKTLLHAKIEVEKAKTQPSPPRKRANAAKSN